MFLISTGTRKTNVYEIINKGSVLCDQSIVTKFKLHKLLNDFNSKSCTRHKTIHNIILLLQYNTRIEETNLKHKEKACIKWALLT